MSNKYGKKYRVHNWVKFDYSEIGEYIDEYHTDKPMRNDELVDLLNEQDREIKRLKCINRQLEERLDRSVALDMSRCEKYIYGIHGGSND